jgi:hypothetical protein
MTPSQLKESNDKAVRELDSQIAEFERLVELYEQMNNETKIKLGRGNYHLQTNGASLRNHQ